MRAPSRWLASLMVAGLLFCESAGAQNTATSITSPIPNRTVVSPIPNRVGGGGISGHTGAMNSMYQNMQGRYVGMGQQVINRTPDNAAGVYWNMMNAQEARERAVYEAMLGQMINPEVYYNLEMQRRLMLQREAARLAEQTNEIKRRQEVRNRTRQPGGTANAYQGSGVNGSGSPGFPAAPTASVPTMPIVGPYGGVVGYYTDPGYGYWYPPASVIPGYGYGPLGGSYYEMPINWGRR